MISVSGCGTECVSLMFMHMTIPTEPASAFLLSAGYRITWRREGIHECLISRSIERWRGVGADDDEAFADALAKAFPSEVAQGLLRSAVERPELVQRATVPPMPKRLVTVPPPPLPTPEVLPLPESSIATLNETPLQNGDSEEPDSPPSLPPTYLPREVVPKKDREEALEELRELRARIDGSLEELTLSTPVRQRAVMLGWICAARAIQDSQDDVPLVYSQVAGIAQTLTGLCKRWWPGSVRALQVNCHPREIAADLPVRAIDPVFSWADGERIVGFALDEFIRGEESRGRDAYGWADGSRLMPPPPNPEALQRETIAAVEQAGGQLGTFPSKDVVPDPAKFLVWCRSLRWLRGCSPDVLKWGALAGRLRWWAQVHGTKLADGNRLLDPAYSPEAPWAAIFGRDKKDLQRRKLVKEVFQGAPAVKDNPSTDVLFAWLCKALPLADTHHSNIVQAMRPFREMVIALDPLQIEGFDRRMRRRLALLQRDLGANVTEELACEEPAETHEAPAEAVEEPSIGALASMSPSVREGILARTEGRTALFVSNRNDPILHERLNETLKFHELAWSECEPRRTAALESAIVAQRYDFVFGATGFFSHSVDGLLMRACRRGNVPYIRVDRGRPLACVRALARELGLEDADAA